jgi:CheY-like chemotaxis protein
MNGIIKAERMSRAEIRLSREVEASDTDELMVMLVNPAPELLDEMSAVLRRRGIAVVKALDPGEALRLLRMEPRIGVVVADIHLLEGEGLTLATQLLHGDPALPSAELVLLTEPRPHAGITGVDIGISAMRLRELAATVGRALSQATLRRSAVCPAGN